ncbi:MAG: hypothetical protein RIS47_387 [Bacteroidota bacterium]
MPIAIIAMILLGVVLLFLEVFVIPGITIAGIGGGILLVVGFFLSFREYGTWVGIGTLGLTLVVTMVMFVLAFRSNTWKSMALTVAVDSKVNTLEIDEVMVGDKARTISRLAPMGKILINDKFYEAKSTLGMVDPEIDVEVVKVFKGQIFVKPINT